MDVYIYGERRPLPEGFAAYHDRWRSAVVSIDMHQGHLADTPDCPLPSAAGPRVGGADRRVSRPSAQPRRADYPCADHFAQTRRREICEGILPAAQTPNPP